MTHPCPTQLEQRVCQPATPRHAERCTACAPVSCCVQPLGRQVAQGQHAPLHACATPAGGSHEGYVKWACASAVRRGWRAVALNLRGCNGLPLTSGRGYNAIQTSDIHIAVASIKGCVHAGSLAWRFLGCCGSCARQSAHQPAKQHRQLPWWSWAAVRAHCCWPATLDGGWGLGGPVQQRRVVNHARGVHTALQALPHRAAAGRRLQPGEHPADQVRGGGGPGAFRGGGQPAGARRSGSCPDAAAGRAAQLSDGTWSGQQQQQAGPERACSQYQRPQRQLQQQG